MFYYHLELFHLVHFSSSLRKFILSTLIIFVNPHVMLDSDDNLIVRSNLQSASIPAEPNSICPIGDQRAIAYLHSLWPYLLIPGVKLTRAFALISL